MKARTEDISVDIKLDQPLHLQIAAIEEAAQKAKAGKAKIYLIGKYQESQEDEDEIARTRGIHDTQIKALMVKLGIHVYAESSDENLAKHGVSVADYTPKFTLEQIQPTKSYFQLNWYKYFVGTTVPTAVVAGGLAALLLLTAVAPPFGLAIWAAIGIGAGIALGVSAIAAGIAYFVENRKDNRVRAAHQCDVASQNWYIARVLDVANNKDSTKNIIQARVNYLKANADDINGKCNELKGLPLSDIDRRFVEGYSDSLSNDHIKVSNATERLYNELPQIYFTMADDAQIYSISQYACDVLPNYSKVDSEKKAVNDELSAIKVRAVNIVASRVVTAIRAPYKQEAVAEKIRAYAKNDVVLEGRCKRIVSEYHPKAEKRVADFTGACGMLSVDKLLEREKTEQGCTASELKELDDKLAAAVAVKPTASEVFLSEIDETSERAIENLGLSGVLTERQKPVTPPPVAQSESPTPSVKEKKEEGQGVGSMLVGLFGKVAGGFTNQKPTSPAPTVHKL